MIRPSSPLCGLPAPLAPGQAEDDGQGDGYSQDDEDEAHLQLDALLPKLLDEKDGTVV